MREDAHDDKTEVGPRHALMQTYVDDPVQPGQQDNAAAATGGTTSGVAGSETAGGGPGFGLPQVV